MSMTMLEAMAFGTVTIVTDVSGTRDVIEDGVNGFIVPVESWMDVVGKIEALSSDREMMHRVSRYNMQMIREKLDAVDYAQWMMDTFGNGF